MGRRSAIPIRWAMWILLWGIAFAALAVGLPARPACCVARRGLFHPKEFLGAETLLISNIDIVHSSRPISEPPFLLLDLPTASIQTVEFPRFAVDANAPEERLSPDSQRIWRSEAIQRWEVFNDFLVVQFLVNDQGWVCVWNWRSGQETWRRRMPPRGTCGVIGRWIWMQEDPRRRSQATDLFDIATGEPAEDSLPDGLPAMRLAVGSGWSVSPDGRSLVDFGGFPARLWSLAGKEGAGPRSRWNSSIQRPSPSPATPATSPRSRRGSPAPQVIAGSGGSWI